MRESKKYAGNAKVSVLPAHGNQELLQPWHFPVECVSLQRVASSLPTPPLVHRMTSGPGRKGRRRSRVSKLLPLVSKQTNNGGSVRPLNLYAEHCDAKYLVCHAETLRSERTHMCTLRIVDGDYLAGRLDAEKAELHQQPMKSSKPGWRGKRGDLGFWKDFKRSCCSCPTTSSENQRGEAH